MNAEQQQVGDDLALSMPLDGLQLIEASAGTGKTYTLAGLFVRLIVERGLSVRQILVMTFTRAATAELRIRLRQRLVACAACADALARGESLPAGDQDQAWAEAMLVQAGQRHGKAMAELAHVLRVAILEMDQASIYTIDGFCKRVLERWSTFFDEPVATSNIEAGDDDLLETFARDVWLKTAGDDDPLALEVLRQLGKTPAGLGELLKKLVHFDGRFEPDADELGPVPDTVPDREAAWQRLVAAWQASGRGAVAAFRSHYSAGYLKHCDEKQLTWLDEIDRALMDGVMPDYGILSWFAYSNVLTKVRAHKPQLADVAAFEAIDEWLGVNNAFDRMLRTGAVRRLSELVAGARQWLVHRKRELQRASYADLLINVERGVAGPHRGRRLAASLREAWPVALLDEFQDTNPRQFRVFRTIYGGDGNLTLVGDPKQAIYGFRGGDVHAYLDAMAAARAAGREPHVLTRNFRSSPAMVEAVNAVFTARSKLSPFMEENIAFHPGVSAGRVADGALRVDGKTMPALTFWPPSSASKVDDRSAVLMAECARSIKKLLADGQLVDDDGQQRPVHPDDIVVLVDKNDQAAAMQDELARHGIAAVCLRRESIYASREAAELLRLLDALLDLRSVRMVRGALATELLGWRLSGLAQLDADPTAWNQVMDQLSGWRERWFGLGLLALLEQVVECHAPRLLALPDGERRLGNLLQLGEALQADTRHAGGPQALRDLLATRIAHADGSNEEEQLRLDSDAKRVGIVTLHRSKGLEYNIVMLPLLGETGANAPKKGETGRYHEDGEAVMRYLWHGSDELKAKHPERAATVENKARSAMADEQTAEKLRCIYVGLTRARHACFAGLGSSKVLAWLLPDGNAVHALCEEHPGVVAMAADTPLAEPPSGQNPSDAKSRNLAAREFAGNICRDWRTFSFSGLTADGHHDAPALPQTGDAADDTTVSIAVPAWPRGPVYGNAVHDIFENTDHGSWKGCQSWPDDRARDLVTKNLKKTGLATGDDDLFKRACDMTGRLVAATLNTPVIGASALADIGADHRRAEMRFDFAMAGVRTGDLLAFLHDHGYQMQRDDYARTGDRLRGLMTGFIDLLVHHDGQWWVIDYKTNHLGNTLDDYRPAALERAVRASDYDLQYLIYLVAVHRWLGLRLGDAYDYERDVGGIRYLFLRGMSPERGMETGVHADKPPVELIVALDRLLAASPENAA